MTVRRLRGFVAEPPVRDDDVQVSGAQTPVAQNRLETFVPTADLPPGGHLLTVVSTDLAGNTTTLARAFTVD